MTTGGPRWLQAWIAWLAALVPARHRTRWREEWTSELWYGFASGATDTPSRRQLSVAIGAAIDALTVRRQARTEPRTSRYGDGMLTNLFHALRYSVRGLRRAPGFSAVVVATLALGIGANTAVFNVLYGTLIKPLKYDEPDRLVRLFTTYWSGSFSGGYLPAPDFVAYRKEVAAFENLAALYDYRETGFNLTREGTATRVRALRISADYFAVYRVAPILGRVFQREEETSDHHLVILSHRLWEEQTGGDPAAIGRSLELDGEPYEIVGVMPEGFYDLIGGDVDLWVPQNLVLTASNSPGNHFLTAIGRLRPTVTLAQARGEVEQVAAGIRERYPEAAQGREGLLVPLADDVAGNAPRLLYLLLGASVLVLLIASVNVANLYLTRTAGRSRELAVRSALGSGRRRIVGQLLTDSFVLALAGGIVGTAIAYFGSRTMLAMAGASLARSHEIGFDGAVLAFTFSVTLITGLGFGLFPAWQMSRPNLEDSLRDAARGASGTRGHQRFRDLLVVTQIALALTLLIGAGLLIKSFARLRNVDLAIRTQGVMTFEFNPPSADYDDAARITLYQDFHDRVRQLPGVTGAGAISRLPVTGRYHTWGFSQPGNPDRGWIPTDMRVVDGDYFSAMAIPVIRGRVFAETDRADTEGVIVLDQQAVQLGFGEEDPIGQTVSVGGQNWRVVGIVADVPYDAEGNVSSKAYVSHPQFAADRNWSLMQVVAYEGGGVGLLEGIRRELHAIDPALVIHHVQPMASIVGERLNGQRLAMTLLSTFAGIAVVLAAVGVYGVLSYGVQLRTREIGIRIALGATARSVRTLVTGRGMILALIGTGGGLIMALGLSRFLESLLFNISVRDPLTFGLVPVGILVVAVISAFLPAARATRVDPLDAIRAE